MLKTLGKSTFSCGQIYIDIYFFIQQNVQSDKTDELSHQISSTLRHSVTQKAKYCHNFRHVG